jgi:hypothetical protein
VSQAADTIWGMRRLTASFVVAPPAGARIRTRLRVDEADARVLQAVGEHLGSLAGADLAARVQSGLPPGGNARAKRTATRDRRRELTAGSSSRWAGTIVRISEDTVARAYDNQLAVQAGLGRAARTIQRRLKVPVGQRHGRVRGYATRAERWAKQQRLQHLQARLAEVQGQLDAARPSVVRGGRGLLNARHNLAAAGLGEQEWRRRWEAARWFLSADGEAGKTWGNETIRVHPDQGWLEVRLPAPLAHLSNTPGRAATYRLSCPVAFSYRQAEWAAQTAGGAVAYTISYDPDRDRWYADAAWRPPARPTPTLTDLQHQRTLGVDLNADHLAGWVITPAGDPLGDPVTIPIDLAGHPASTRHGRLRAAISDLLAVATTHGCASVTIENLDFADARVAGRETLGRGRRGKRLRRVVAGIPTAAFRDLLVGMAANAGVWVVAVDPAYTSRWGGRYWQAPLQQSTKRPVTVSRHHAASVVIGRRGLGHHARRRERCAPGGPEDPPGRATFSAGQPTTAASSEAAGVPKPAQEPGGPGGQRAGPLVVCQTRLPERTTAGDQATQDHSGPPVSAH